MSDLPASTAAGQRGPADHSIRDQIIAAADEHFSRYGYGKTTVADLAKAIGFSKAYIYKFFESKQAIGEAICSKCLASVTTDVRNALTESKSATEKLRRLLNTIAVSTTEIAFNDQKIYEIAAYSCAENWPSSVNYVDEMAEIVTSIVLEGRASGEFERKTPIDEAVRATMLVFQPFMNPAMLQYNLDAVPEGANEVASLVLRSLAP
ncbi:TetR/AcrR family transcriptional regulator [Sphingomonas sp. CGMCC 1.13654]|uniref:TetR/AcrR family transcriptional regulator n=1 Tax=Sphingomonas chungangi TaxID=2683589 RepID=A0A838L9F8_9SPHN|nr:TetR/AcrR family transcriptional regulator [Sphingomonas chungangi]MBA2935911.1 TetR/AcrR family transcriptional regulator [Sphingomonas chungangi]MVW54602.1 TetR family transcriptional regulator [Sphingomonas chungangi]